MKSFIFFEGIYFWKPFTFEFFILEMYLLNGDLLNSVLHCVVLPFY